MISDRPYRKSMSVEEAFLEIERCSGSQFDPEIAHLFIKTMRNKMYIKYNYNINNEDSLGWCQLPLRFWSHSIHAFSGDELNTPHKNFC